jgi:uncharacterized membrane protein YdbT with pleckstrin-like domain
MAVKAMKRPKELDRYLVPDERIVLIHREHWIALAEPILVTVAWLFLLGWLDQSVSLKNHVLFDAAMWVWFFLIARLIWKLIDWKTDLFIATDRRLLKTYGIISRQVAMMPLAKVTDMSYVRTIPGKAMGYGTFRLESAGQDQALSTIKFVPNPDYTYKLITTEIFKPPARRATDVRPPPGSGSALPVVEPDDVWWKR